MIWDQGGVCIGLNFFNNFLILNLQAARFNAVAQNFKQKSLNVRVFGYPSATQLDQDSFILFTQGVEMKVSLFLQQIDFLSRMGEGRVDHLQGWIGCD